MWVKKRSITNPAGYFQINIFGPGLQEAIRESFSFVADQTLHEQVVHSVQLLVRVKCGEQVLAVLMDGLQDHQAVIGVILVLALGLGGEERLVGLAIVLQGIHEFQNNLFAVLIRDCDKSRAEVFAHGVSSFVPYVGPLYSKLRRNAREEALKKRERMSL